MNRMGTTFCGVVLAMSFFACKSNETPRFDEINFAALDEPCACLEAAAVLYDHTSDLVLEIKHAADETRRRTNLGQPTSDALLDSMLMLSEQMRAVLDGPGRELDRACKDVVDFDAVGQGTEGSDCSELAPFQRAFQRLRNIKEGVQP
jgi:hypothetical protein